MKDITKYCIPLIVILLSFAYVSEAKGTPSLETVIEKLQEFYNNVDDLQAGFLHRAPVALTETTLEERGIFYYKKPSRLRWEYDDPENKLMVVNPEVTWIYLPDDNRVYRQKTDEALSSRIVIRFLSGVGKLEEDFSISFAAPLRDEEGRYRVELVPREYLGGVQKLTVMIDEKTFFIAGYAITDPYGTTSTYTFTDPVINQGLPDELFFQDPPEGARIEDLI